MKKMTREEHIHEAKKIEDLLSSYKLEKTEDIVNALAKYDEYMKMAAEIGDQCCPNTGAKDNI